MSKFDGKGDIKYVNPNSDYFADPNKCTPDYLDINHPPHSYDIVHIHFSFDKLSLRQLKKLLNYFKVRKKPIVWTIHSKESQRIKNYRDGKYQKLLFNRADRIISPTRGCKKWVEDNLGKHEQDIKVIPLGYTAAPQEVSAQEKNIKKDPNLFTYLIGDFRENKEFIKSVKRFLSFKELENVRLNLIFKPTNKPTSKIKRFLDLIKNNRVQTLCKPEIPNEDIIKSFLLSHAIILPYKWGTHSGQIEMAKDCGCHVVVSDVGFYKEQSNDIVLWNPWKPDGWGTGYKQALTKAWHRKSLKPAGISRNKELQTILQLHLKIYKNLLDISKT